MKNSSTLRIVVVSWLWVLCLVIKDGCALELCGAHLEPNKGVVGSTVSIINRSTDCKIIADEEYRCGFKFEDANVTIVVPAIITPKKISCVAPPSPKTLPTNVKVSFGPGSNFNATTWYGIYGYFTYTVAPPTVEPTSSTPTITQPPTGSEPTTTPSISDAPSSQLSVSDAPSNQPSSQPALSNAPSNHPSSTSSTTPSITNAPSMEPSKTPSYQLSDSPKRIESLLIPQKCCCKTIRSNGTCVASNDTFIAFCNIVDFNYNGVPSGKECNLMNQNTAYETECTVRKDCFLVDGISQLILPLIFIVGGFIALFVGYENIIYTLLSATGELAEDKRYIFRGITSLFNCGISSFFFGLRMIGRNELAYPFLAIWIFWRLYIIYLFTRLVYFENKGMHFDPEFEDEKYKHKHIAKSIYQSENTDNVHFFLTFIIQIILLGWYIYELCIKEIDLNNWSTFYFFFLGIVVQYVLKHKRNISIDESIEFWHHAFMVLKHPEEDNYIPIGRVEKSYQLIDGPVFNYRLYFSIFINHVYYDIIVIFLPFQLCTFQDPISFATGAAGAYFMAGIDDCTAEEVGSSHNKLIKEKEEFNVVYYWLKQKFKNE